MTYGDLKKTVLSLLNQYSLAGAEIDASYNNQADYLRRIPLLANQAISQIATTAKYITATVPLSSLTMTQVGANRIYTMPSDFYKMRTYAVLDMDRVPPESIPVRQYNTENTFLFPDPNGRTFSVSYYRLPTLLPETPDESTELDNTAETHPVVALYVAAHLVMYDDSYQHASLYNEYETALSRLRNSIVAEILTTEDIYGAGPLEWEG